MRTHTGIALMHRRCSAGIDSTVHSAAYSPGARRDDLVRVAFLPQKAEDGVERRQADRAFAQPFGVQPVLVKPQAGRENVGDALMQAGDEDATDAGFAHVSV